MSVRVHRVARICLRSSQVGAALLVLSPLVYRFGLVGLQVAFGSLALGLLVCLVVLLVASVTWWLARRQPHVVRQARAAVLVSILVLAFPAWTALSNRGAPPIHHITTDPDDPPEFVAVVPLRGASSNPIAYPGGDVEARQREAYPDLGPLLLTAAPAEAFTRSLEVAEALGWEVVAAVEDEGRIEATDTTWLFGFKDDVVVRIRPDDGGSRVDLRSVSRVGVGDLGANAGRIRAFMRRLAP